MPNFDVLPKKERSPPLPSPPTVGGQNGGGAVRGGVSSALFRQNIDRFFFFFCHRGRRLRCCLGSVTRSKWIDTHTRITSTIYIVNIHTYTKYYVRFP